MVANRRCTLRPRRRRTYARKPPPFGCGSSFPRTQTAAFSSTYFDPRAEVRLEYGDENFFPSNYHVESITEATDAVRVELRPPQTTCKARDRRAAGASCCC